MSKQQARREWTSSEKLALIQQTYVPGMCVSVIAKRRGVNPGHLRQWRDSANLAALVALSACSEVVPVGVLDDAQQRIMRLERSLSRQAAENLHLKEALGTLKKMQAQQGRHPAAQSVLHEQGD